MSKETDMQRAYNAYYAGDPLFVMVTPRFQVVGQPRDYGRLYALVGTHTGGTDLTGAPYARREGVLIPGAIGKSSIEANALLNRSIDDLYQRLTSALYLRKTDKPHFHRATA